MAGLSPSRIEATGVRAVQAVSSASAASIAKRVM